MSDAAVPTPRSPGRSSWIVGPGVDGVFILGLPVLCFVAVHAATSRWTALQIWAVVMTFGAVGHHLPGFIRTYGDRELFARHRARFILAPVLVFACTVWFAQRDLHGVLLISLVWSIWHGMMQHYGFMRIYAAKAGATQRRTARLDWWITVAWFGLCLTMSPHQKASVLDSMYVSGFDIVPARVLDVLEQLALVTVVVVTTLYVADLMRRRREGEPVSGAKLVLLVTTTGLVYVARVATADPFLSVALFEVMHDVQYLAIVWAFNRRRVDESGVLAAALFRPGRARVLVYVGLCLAYGAIGFAANEMMEESASKQLLVAALTTSGILHFYYDGFIWKLKRPDTRAGLELERDGPSTSDGGTTRRDLVHAAAFVIPVLVLARMESSGTQTELAQAEAIVEASPDDVTARQNAGAALMAEGRVEDALPHLQAAVELHPDLAEARRRLARALIALGRDAEAIPHLEHALAIEPSTPDDLHLLGTAKLGQGELEAALDHLVRATEAGLDTAAVNNDLGYALLNLRRFDEAEGRLQRAVLIDPNHAGAFLNLGLLYGSTRQLDAAEQALRRAVSLDPNLPDAHNNLGGVLMMTGRRDAAITSFRQALAIDPQFAPAKHNLDRALAAG